EIVAERVDPELLDRLQPAVSLMDRAYTQALNIDDLAHQCHLSTAHFRRLFRKAYGLSPQQYIQNLRIAKAKDLIRSELYSMSEVAARSGFGNIYYFSRVFRQATGMPPSAYSRQ
ncbi:MAG: helix-turn-helix transcriptional regulator, partial [Clostridiaceae bacterium]|nr:helix-turn-helix transcriptional regulator [Clostridiaceae bacterium]